MSTSRRAPARPRRSLLPIALWRAKAVRASAGVARRILDAENQQGQVVQEFTRQSIGKFRQMSLSAVDHSVQLDHRLSR
eukprot:COSAG06_NODE_49042_length_328_cov_0.672489_1_plen_79_part_00